jgi:hypothetical protein
MKRVLMAVCAALVSIVMPGFSRAWALRVEKTRREGRASEL